VDVRRGLRRLDALIISIAPLDVLRARI
jgi:hypothetical protein